MGVLDTIKDVATLVQKADNIELNQKILELQSQIMNLLNENHTLRGQVRDLSERVELQDSLTFKDNMYWRTLDEGVDGPFCSKCWDTDRKLVRLQTLGNQAQYCPACKRSTPGTGTPPPPRQRRIVAQRGWATNW